MASIALIFGASFGLLGVVTGAFGAHVLKARLEPELLSAWQTAVEYQFYHAFALLAVGLLALSWPANAWLNWAGLSYIAGILLFSGSLYLLALTDQRWLGAITPFGGLLLIFGWVFLLIAVLRQA